MVLLLISGLCCSGQFPQDHCSLSEQLSRSDLRHPIYYSLPTRKLFLPSLSFCSTPLQLESLHSPAERLKHELLLEDFLPWSPGDPQTQELPVQPWVSHPTDQRWRAGRSGSSQAVQGSPRVRPS